MMATYRAPLDDYRFLIDRLAPSLVGADGRSRWSEDGDVLHAFATFCETVLEPRNRVGDEAGCRLIAGRVQTPAGFREAYDHLCAGGWTAVPEGEAEGQVASVATFCMDEMLGAANIAFSNYLGPTKRVAQVLAASVDTATFERELDALRSGRVGGTLCLTEPHCGTDLGLVATRAQPADGAGAYQISGSKIFVTSGDHDLTENILHLVLARIEGDPDGPRGLSLFLVPRDTDAGEANGVVCAGIEQKMGLHGSATCALQFEKARGVLVGARGQGLKTIFPTMEAERRVIALQSLGLAEHALQKAQAYALERLQGRAATGARRPELPADPIAVHADVRRMLLTMRAYVEGGRAMLGWTAAHIDLARREPDPDAARAANDFVLLMTPMMKAFITDLGVEVTNLGIQVLGGHGYIRESGVEQFARDARVTPLYAGANGIQALDLIQRKLPGRSGRMLDLFLEPSRAALCAWRGAPEAGQALSALEKLEVATAHLAMEGRLDPDLAGAVGTDYVHLFGHVALTVVWAQTGLLAQQQLETTPPDAQGFLRSKIATARFYLQRLAPIVDWRLSSLLAGSEAVMDSGVV